MVQEIPVKVSKEAYELGQGIKKFIRDIKGALADGWQPGNDLPVILAATLADLIPALQGVEKLGSEIKENESAFISAFLQSTIDITFLFIPTNKPEGK